MLTYPAYGLISRIRNKQLLIVVSQALWALKAATALLDRLTHHCHKDDRKRLIMHRYQIRRLHQSEKLVIEFLSRPEDAAFRAALSSVFCPLGYVSKFDGHYFYLDPGPSKPHEGSIAVSSDEFGMVWCDGDPWGEVRSNLKWINLVDSLLQASGLFIKT